MPMWNPWRGCKKCSEGCLHCYIHKGDAKRGVDTSMIVKTTLKSMLSVGAEVTAGTVYAAMAAGMVFCAGEAVLAKFAEHYFKRELADGTPFTLDGAKELNRLGVLTICLPIGTQIAAEIVHAVMEQAMQGVAPLSLNSSASAALGVMFIILSLICRYGAEQHEENKAVRNL